MAGCTQVDSGVLRLFYRDFLYIISFGDMFYFKQSQFFLISADPDFVEILYLCVKTDKFRIKNRSLNVC